MYSGAVIGNGMALGMTNGTTNYGARTYTAMAGAAPVIGGVTDAYGSSLPNNIITGTYLTSNAFGITTDPTKSGLICESDSELVVCIHY